MAHCFLPVRFVRRRSAIAALLCILLASRVTAAAEGLNQAALQDDYRLKIRPLIERFCVDCHGSVDVIEADVNLEAMPDWDEAIKHPRTWQQVAEMLGNGLMPPEEAEQPSADERTTLQQWVRDYLTLEARAHAGDPGRVILRRLSNAEYTNNQLARSGSRVSSRRGGGRRIHKHGRCASDVA
jgi:hypothetical protein